MDDTDLPPLRANAAFASAPEDELPVGLAAASIVVVTVLFVASRPCTATAATPPPARAATAANAAIAPFRGRRSEGREGGEGGEEEDAGNGGSWKTGRGSFAGRSNSMALLYPGEVERPLESGWIRVKQSCAHHVSVGRRR